jgi:dihydropteroate synthase
VSGEEGAGPAAGGRWVMVTGQLAREPLESLAAAGRLSGEYRIEPLPISVAALLTLPFLRQKLKCAAGERVLLPGLCKIDPAEAARELGVPVEKGPKDLRDLPAWLGRPGPGEEYGEHDLEILAEINDAAELSLAELIAAAERYRACGADVIDLGCTPGRTWEGVGEAVRALRGRGLRVSVDSFNPEEVARADAAGADYILSLNSQNLHLAAGLRAVPVIVPDSGGGVESLAANVERARAAGARRILLDPVLEPIHFGLAASIRRYCEARERFPEEELLMGVGNLTELTEADSTGVNAVCLGIMSELGIRHVLTTEVAPWARGCVRELDAGRRLMHYARRRQALPKGIDASLLTCRDSRPTYASEAELRALQARLADLDYRIDIDGRAIHVFNRREFVTGTNLRDIFMRLDLGDDAPHAFYLGRELMKAQIALRLGKKYVQGEPLDWGYLTWPEDDDPPGYEEVIRASRRRASERERRRSGAPAPEGRGPKRGVGGKGAAPRRAGAEGSGGRVGATRRRRAGS